MSIEKRYIYIMYFLTKPDYGATIIAHFSRRYSYDTFLFDS